MMIEKGELNFKDISISEVLLYIKLNEEYLDRGYLEKLEEFLPSRKRTGRSTQMTEPRVRRPRRFGSWVRSRNIGSTRSLQWGWNGRGLSWGW